ncbi:MAG: transporter substrate-binding domain-containing protein [Betaproteobacteria bacterium]
MNEVAPTGVLHIGINLGNPVIAQRSPEGDEPLGIGAALGRAFANQLGLPYRFRTWDTAGKMADAAQRHEWDIAFLAVDPARAADIDFTAPYVHIEGTCMVRQDSPAISIADLDQPGNQIAVALKSAYDLFLSRDVRHATLIREPDSDAAVDAFLSRRLEAVAGIRQPLEAAAQAQPGLRVLAQSFMTIRQAAGVPKGRTKARQLLAQFIEDSKRNGLVARALADSGVGPVTIAPPASDPALNH